jgi:subfamily B ATP-binding cassette protein MsbA
MRNAESYTTREVMRRFLAYARPYRPRVAAATLGNFYTVGVVMVTPLVVRYVIDRAIPARDVTLLLGAVGLFLTLSLSRGLVGYAHHYLQHYVGYRIIFDLRKALFHHLQLLHLSFFEREKTASLVNRVINDVGAIQQFINQAFSTITNSLVALVMAVCIMATLNWRLTLLCLAILPAYFATVRLFRRRLYRGSHDVRQRQAALAGMLGETLSGIRVVKAFAQEEYEEERFVSAITDNFLPELNLTMLSHRMGAFLVFMTDLTYGTVLVIGGWAVVGGRMTVGELVAFSSYLVMLFNPMQSFATLLQVTITARTGFERVLALLDTHPKVLPAETPARIASLRGHVVFDHVSFRYAQLPALQDVNLEVRPGEIIALVGPSGAGKTTLASLLTRFYDVDEGRILVDGVDLRQLDYDEYRRQIGIVLQDSFLFTGTIEENIRYGKPEATMAELREAARQAHALGFIEEMPDGFRSRVGQGGVTLSGGQRQRIAIARAILKNPRILIFDEATSALDAESEALIQESLDRLMTGKTVFIVAHRFSTIQRANRIVVMDRGRIAEVGAHHELLARRGLYHRLYHPRVPSEAALTIP